MLVVYIIEISDLSGILECDNEIDESANTSGTHIVLVVTSSNISGQSGMAETNLVVLSGTFTYHCIIF